MKIDTYEIPDELFEAYNTGEGIKAQWFECGSDYKIDVLFLKEKIEYIKANHSADSMESKYVFLCEASLAHKLAEFAMFTALRKGEAKYVNMALKIAVDIHLTLYRRAEAGEQHIVFDRLFIDLPIYWATLLGDFNLARIVSEYRIRNAQKCQRVVLPNVPIERAVLFNDYEKIEFYIKEAKKFKKREAMYHRTIELFELIAKKDSKKFSEQLVWLFFEDFKEPPDQEDRDDKYPTLVLSKYGNYRFLYIISFIYFAYTRDMKVELHEYLNPIRHFLLPQETILENFNKPFVFNS